MATFQSVGTTPVARDKLMINVKGFVMTSAASLSNPGGRLSRPVAFFQLPQNNVSIILKKFNTSEETNLLNQGKISLKKLVTEHNRFCDICVLTG